MTRLVAIGLAFSAAVAPVLAIDGGIGRTLTGTWVLPGVAIVGPDPGPGLKVLPIGYRGVIGGSRLDPVAGVIVFNDQADASVNVVIAGYDYKLKSKKVNLASAILVPTSWWGASGSQLIGGNFIAARNANASVGDVILVPLVFGLRFSETHFLAISNWIWAPSGLFRAGNISNVGMGIWSFMPNVSHTYYWEKYKLEFDNFLGFDIYTNNAATNYKSGTMFHWDSMIIRYFGKKRFGVGAIGARQTQVTEDTGPVAETLNGFVGRKWGVGPTVVYVARTEKPGVTLQFRWINEFRVTNMLKGNIFMGGVYFNLKSR